MSLVDRCPKGPIASQDMIKHLIIDGYNLLGVRDRVGARGGDAASARDKLLRDLAAYRQEKLHPITVVFDGWQQGLGAEHREHRSGIEVVYSRRGERADQVVQRMAEEFRGDCAVVSSDGEVSDFARVQGAFVIGAMEFERRLHEATKAPAPSRRVAAPGKDGEERPRRGPEKKGNPKKLPKAVRKRLRQLRSF